MLLAMCVPSDRIAPKARVSHSPVQLVSIALPLALLQPPWLVWQGTSVNKVRVRARLLLANALLGHTAHLAVQYLPHVPMALMVLLLVYNEQVIASRARLDGTVLDLALPRRQANVVLGITVLVAKVHQRPVALFALLAPCVLLVV